MFLKMSCRLEAALKMWLVVYGLQLFRKIPAGREETLAVSLVRYFSKFSCRWFLGPPKQSQSRSQTRNTYYSGTMMQHF